MTLPQTRERRSYSVGAAPWKSYDGDETRIPTASAPEGLATPLFVADLLGRLAEAEHAPSCTCGDWGRALALVLALASEHECTAHPAIVESVARTFAGWDGAEAAHARSVAHFHAWHAQARAELKEETDHDRRAA